MDLKYFHYKNISIDFTFKYFVPSNGFRSLKRKKRKNKTTK